MAELFEYFSLCVLACDDLASDFSSACDFSKGMAIPQHLVPKQLMHSHSIINYGEAVFLYFIINSIILHL